MWIYPCCRPVPCVCCRPRCLPCRSPCCSYTCATPPPSPMSGSLLNKKKPTKPKKKKKISKAKFSPSDLALMTASQIGGLTMSQLALLTPSMIALLSPSKQALVMQMKNQAEGKGDGSPTRRCDPRCRAHQRPSSAGCTPRTPPADYCPANYNKTICACHAFIESAGKPDIKSKLKINAATSTNQLDFFLCAQKATNGNKGCICGNSIQELYRQALQQQWMQNCYYYHMMTQQNPSGFNRNRVAPNSLQNSLQALQGALYRPMSSPYPCSSIFSSSISPSVVSQMSPSQNNALSWPGSTNFGYPNVSAKQCGTCGRHYLP